MNEMRNNPDGSESEVICAQEPMEAYHSAYPDPEDIYETTLPPPPTMKTNGRRSLHMGPKGNYYPVPKRGR